MIKINFANHSMIGVMQETVEEGDKCPIPELIQFMTYDSSNMAVVATFFNGIQYAFGADTFVKAKIGLMQASLFQEQWRQVKEAIEEIYLNTMREQFQARQKMH